MRSNHFHTGLDIKTNGRINYRIYSIDTGFVSRINVSKRGYGKAIYVAIQMVLQVYAHLDHFPEKIEKILEKRQYELQTETLTYYLDSLDLTVSKGEVIAYSGNTGDHLDLIYILKLEKLSLNILLIQSYLTLILWIISHQ